MTAPVGYLAVVAAGPGATAPWRVRPLSPAGDPAGDEKAVDADDVAEWPGVRLLWDTAARQYPPLLEAGVEVGRCHDVTLTERILQGREARFGEPASSAAVYARARGLPVTPDRDPGAPVPEPGLFDPQPPKAPEVDPMTALVGALPVQLARIGDDNALRLLVAAESAAALAAVEMGRRGLPWDVIEHDRLLTALLGPRPARGHRPTRMTRLAGEISAAFGFAVNPDSVTELREAFRRSGFAVETTRSWVLQQIDHPAVPLVLEYKELSRLFSANGWGWIDDWVIDGRLRSEFLPGGVVSGRWATRGGGGLQLPRALRGAARALPGHRLVVADAAQLEPRVLAAISRDPALLAVSTDVDLYDGLAADGFGGDRGKAKVSMLGAMYGATSGEAGRLLATLRRRYPAAMDCVEQAARTGEAGGVVRSVLGRASPPPGAEWQQAMAQAGGEAADDLDAAASRRTRERARSWGRFTRNFVVQASAADWASVWLSLLRQDIRGVDGDRARGELVFFQHDEIVVHVPEVRAQEVAEQARSSAARATALVFPGVRVSIPVRPAIVGDYAAAK